MDILSRADEFIRAYESREQKILFLDEQISNLVIVLKTYPNDLKLLEEVRIFMQTLAEATRDEIMTGLEEIVTRCLQSVFGPELSFEIEVETKRNNVGVEFYVVDTSGEHPVRLPPVGNMPGGAIDTIAIGLRFGLLKFITPIPEGPMYMDEPAKMVSSDRVISIANLLKELSDLFGIQIIMVTHHEALLDLADNSIYVKKEKGRSICVQ